MPRRSGRQGRPPDRLASQLGKTKEEEKKDEDGVTAAGGEDSDAVDAEEQGDTGKYSCPHCRRQFTSEGGLKYHVAKWVCRPDERPANEKPKKRGRSKTPGEAASSGPFKKFRGALEDRRCPHCKKVFTSALGKQYHVKNKVCESANGRRTGASSAVSRLQPGERFVTMYGVVEVVEDVRSVHGENDPPVLSEMDQKRHARRNRQLRAPQVIQHKTGVQSLIQRRLWNDDYEASRDHQDNKVFAPAAAMGAICGLRPVVKVKPPAVAAKPNEVCTLAMQTAWEERIVKCKLIPDAQTRKSVGFHGSDDLADEDMLQEPPPPNCAPPRVETLLYLRRKTLSHCYKEGTEVFCCYSCGLAFASWSGFRYHATGTGRMLCQDQAIKKAEAIRKRVNDIERYADRICRLYPRRPRSLTDMAAMLADAPPRQAAKRKRVSMTAAIKARRNPPVYTQLLLCMGFKLLPQDEQRVKVSAYNSDTKDFGQGDDVPTKGSPNKKKKKQPTHFTAKAPVDMEPDPREVLRALKHEVHIVQSKLIGPVYPGVVKGLKFRLVKQKEQSVPDEKNTPEPPEQKPLPQVETKLLNVDGSNEHSKKPLPQLIDTRILITEVDAGRYPSSKRVAPDVVRQKHCSLCRGIKGTLHDCNYCPTRFHWKCLRARYTVKNPEPKEAVICHKCIGIVISRRSRAEKRRVEKILLGENKGGIAASVGAVEKPVNGILGGDLQSVAQEQQKLTCGVVSGREYDCLAVQCRNLIDLQEIVKDAQVRLSNCMEISRINSVRGEWLEDCEKLSLF